MTRLAATIIIGFILGVYWQRWQLARGTYQARLPY